MDKKDIEIVEDSYRDGCENAAQKHDVSLHNLTALRKRYQTEHPLLYKKTVARHRSRHLAKRDVFPSEDKFRACEIAINSSVEEAAKETGYPKRYIHEWLDRATSPDFKGFTGGRKIYSTEERVKILSYANKYSIANASETFGCAKSIIRKWQKQSRCQNQEETTVASTNSDNLEANLRKKIIAAKTLDELQNVAHKIKYCGSLKSEAVLRLNTFWQLRKNEILSSARIRKITFVPVEKESQSDDPEPKVELSNDTEQDEDMTEDGKQNDSDEEEIDENDIRFRFTSYGMRKIVRYSFEHSAEETANRFNIPEYSVQSLRKDFRREFRDEYKERIAIYSFCYGRQETMVEFKISRNSVDTYRREFRTRRPERYAELVEGIKSSVRRTDERKKLSEDQKNDMKEPSAEVEVVDVQKDEPVTETATLRIEELKKENASLKDKLLALLLKQVGLVQIIIFSFLHYR